MENLAETIKHVPFFSGLSREDLARIVAQLEEQNFSAGEKIVCQGEAGDALFVVNSGAVEVVLEHNGLRVESVAILGSYDCFGEMSLFTGQQRSATVVALVNSTVLKLRKETWEELLEQHPSLSFHFCKILSQRLAETNREVSKARGAFNIAMEKFFGAQSPEIQDFLVRTSILKTLDLQAFEKVLSLPGASQLLASLSVSHPIFIRISKNGNYEYIDFLRKFLSVKLEQKLPRQQRDELHLQLASYFSRHEKWGPATYHFLKAEAWKEALQLLETHGDELLESEAPKDLLELLDALPLQLARAHGPLARLRAEAHVRLGDLDAAVHSYQEFLAQKEVTSTESLETARCYRELAELHRRKGEVGEALGCLRLGLTALTEDRVNTDVLEAMQSIGLLQQRKGLPEAAVRWSEKTIQLVQRLQTVKGAAKGFLKDKKWLGSLLAFAFGWTIWNLPPPEPLDANGMHFLATLAAAVTLLVTDAFDEYVVAILLLLLWLVSGTVRTDLALAGFSKSSWFFVVGALGMAAAVIKSGLIYRVALQVLKRLSPSYKSYTLLLTTSGILATPLLPKIQARLAIMAPISQAISEAMGFEPRSNGSAGITLAAYIGFSQMSFMFLTGATVCLVGWNLLPETARAEFGWGAWVLAALPSGILILFFLLFAIHFLFPVKDKNQIKVSPKTLEAQLEILGPLTRDEWLGIAILGLAVLGWLAKPYHGIEEAWIALGALFIFSIAGVLDKTSFKNNIDWGYLLFLGVISSLSEIMPHLGIDLWLASSLSPLIAPVSYHPMAFLMTVALLVYGVRLFLNKTPAVIVLTVALVPWAQKAGVHPGILLLTILLALESWFLVHQTDSYQIAYYATAEKGFSHAQARRLMVAKFLASLLAIAISVPYWKMLGLIQ